MFSAHRKITLQWLRKSITNPGRRIIQIVSYNYFTFNYSQQININSETISDQNDLEFLRLLLDERIEATEAL